MLINLHTVCGSQSLGRYDRLVSPPHVIVLLQKSDITKI